MYVWTQFPKSFFCRLYAYEVDKSCDLNENLGAGIAVFQGLSNITLNCECILWWKQINTSHDTLYSHCFGLCAVNTGIVLGTIFAGGTLIASSEMSPGDLMSFLVASQTVQRYKTQPVWQSLLFMNIYIQCYLFKCSWCLGYNSCIFFVLRSLASISILFGQVNKNDIHVLSVTFYSGRNQANLLPFVTDGERNKLWRSGFWIPVSEADYSTVRRRTHPVPFSDRKSGFHGHFIQVNTKQKSISRHLVRLTEHKYQMILFFLYIYTRSYPTRPGHQILSRFNLTMPPSKTIAIVGESGGGNDSDCKRVTCKQCDREPVMTHVTHLREVHCGVLAGAFLRPGQWRYHAGRTWHSNPWFVLDEGAGHWIYQSGKDRSSHWLYKVSTEILGLKSESNAEML